MKPLLSWRSPGRPLVNEAQEFFARGDVTKEAAGFTDAALAAARDFQRRAQFYLDFVEAENSTGFHAPQEAARVLAESIDFARRGQLALRDARRPRRP